MLHPVGDERLDCIGVAGGGREYECSCLFASCSTGANCGVGLGIGVSSRGGCCAGRGGRRDRLRGVGVVAARELIYVGFGVKQQGDTICEHRMIILVIFYSLFYC